MTRRSKRELERALDGLTDDRTGSSGVYIVRIGGDPDADEGGHYTWDAARGVYVNDAGDTIPPEDAPDGEGGCEIHIGTEGESAR